MKSRRLLVVTAEPPFPPNHGGRVDQWNRWRSLKALGWEMDLVTWLDEGSVSVDVEAALRRVFDEVVAMPRRGDTWGRVLRQIAYLWVYPTHVASRAAGSDGIASRLPAADYGAVFLDGLAGGHFAVRAAEKLGVPLLYRSHNIEHKYMVSQMRAAGSLTARMRIGMTTWRLRRFEEGIHSRACQVFDISRSDMEYWKARRLSDYVYAPPLLGPMPVNEAISSEQPAPTYDFVYLGNLNTPNNTAGIRWFTSDVLPLIRTQHVDASLLVGGSSPAANVVDELSKCPGVTVEIHPPNAAAFRARGRVLINPVRSGSGVNVKSVEMLATSRPIVTTLVAVQGLPSEAQSKFNIAEGAQAFADACCSALRNPNVDREGRLAVLALFSTEGAKRLSEQIRSTLDAA